MKLINIFLFFVSSFVFSQNYLTLLDTDVFRGYSYDIPIDLINNDPIRAIQYDINIPEGFIFDIDNVTQTPILNDFTTLISSLGNNNYRFIIYTIGNDIINSGNQTILTLPVFVENSIDLGQYTFQFSNVVLSSETNQNISSDAPSVGYIYVTEDSIAPVITLLGDATVSIEVGDTYIDAGATAKDNYDGDITSNIVTVSNVDTAIVGSYTVTYDVSDANENAAATVTRLVTVEDALSMVEIEKIELDIFPNPTSSIWQIKSSKMIESFDLFDLTGKRLIYKKTLSNDFQIDATSLPDGVYFILINNNKLVRLIKH
ncbi:DUF5011 domain-containing protein [Flavobacteriaceae bacterium]|nr:DUF5011 domain-containing protein [Flavobacteriaceae bacterium]